MFDPLLPDAAIAYVADNGEDRDGHLVVNVQLADKRMVHFRFVEGAAIRFSVSEPFDDD